MAQVLISPSYRRRFVISKRCWPHLKIIFCIILFKEVWFQHAFDDPFIIIAIVIVKMSTIMKAFLFYLPRMIWLSMEGGLMAFLCEGCSGSTSSTLLPSSLSQLAGSGKWGFFVTDTHTQTLHHNRLLSISQMLRINIIIVINNSIIIVINIVTITIIRIIVCYQYQGCSGSTSSTLLSSSLSRSSFVINIRDAQV